MAAGMRLREVLAEDLLALLACKHNVCGLGQLVVLTLRVALSAVEPQLAARRAHLHLK